MRISDWSSDVCSADLSDWRKASSSSTRKIFLPLATLIPKSPSKQNRGEYCRFLRYHRCYERSSRPPGKQLPDRSMETVAAIGQGVHRAKVVQPGHVDLREAQAAALPAGGVQIGRASCRDKVGQYG